MFSLTEQRWKVLPNEATPTAPPTKETTPSDEAVEQCLSSKFHFVDLAGSERVGRTGNLGERFKGQHVTTLVPGFTGFIV